MGGEMEEEEKGLKYVLKFVMTAKIRHRDVQWSSSIVFSVSFITGKL